MIKNHDLHVAWESKIIFIIYLSMDKERLIAAKLAAMQKTY